MKRPQVSTTGGIFTLLAGFLAVYQDVKIMDFFEVFRGLTWGQVVTMVMPLASGLWMVLHNEKGGGKNVEPAQPEH